MKYKKSYIRFVYKDYFIFIFYKFKNYKWNN